jgi:2-polyprenyl-3-methyl-5-hydroxy-6-metoxy-1,4-benzoquinol methylase
VPTSIKFWNKRAPKYDKKLYKGPNYAARLERAAAAFGENANVLDVGCATGEITLDSAQHAKQILGIDHATSMTDTGNVKARERGIENCRFEPLDANDPALEEQSFDAITVYSVFHLIENPPGGPGVSATIARLHALLKPQGHLITETPVLGDWNLGWKVILKLCVLIGIAPPITALKLADLEQMFTAAGFELLESKVYNPKSGMHCILARKR